MDNDTTTTRGGLSEKVMLTLAEDCARVLGFSPLDFLGCNVLTTIRAAERAGATIYWGCLPDVSVLRSSCFWWVPAMGE